jgi:DNA replication protein DnaC
MKRTLNPDLVRAMKRLRLGPLVDTLPERLALSEASALPLDELLLMLLTDEITRRDGSAAARRAERADLDRDMVLERWDKSSTVQFDRRVYSELCTLRFLEARRNIAFLGPVGVGKTFLASAIGHLACRGAFSVRFVRADVLLRELRQSRMDNSREAVMTELCTVDLLIIDDFALDPLAREESRDMYEIFVERNARFSTIVTSNRDTSEWLATFDDPLLAQSAIDRFRNNAYDVVIEGESYRPRLKPKIEVEIPPPAAPVVKRPGGPRRSRRS